MHCINELTLAAWLQPELAAIIREEAEHRRSKRQARAAGGVVDKTPRRTTFGSKLRATARSRVCTSRQYNLLLNFTASSITPKSCLAFDLNDVF